MDTVSPLETSLRAMQLTEVIKAFVQDNRDTLLTFGRMNSHLYRKDLMERFTKATLNGEQMFMIYLLFSLVKSQPRVLKALRELPEEVKAQTWFAPVVAFVDSQIAQYVVESSKNKKFPAVNIPNTNPGLDLLCFLLVATPTQFNFSSVVLRPTFVQLALSSTLQAYAKEGYMMFWTTIVKRSRNPDRNKAAEKDKEAREEDRVTFYETQAADQYPLVNPDLSLVEVPQGGYSAEDLKNYFLLVSEQLRSPADQAEITAEVEKMWLEAVGPANPNLQAGPQAPAS